METMEKRVAAMQRIKNGCGGSVEKGCERGGFSTGETREEPLTELSGTCSISNRKIPS